MNTLLNNCKIVNIVWIDRGIILSIIYFILKYYDELVNKVIIITNDMYRIYIKLLFPNLKIKDYKKHKSNNFYFNINKIIKNQDIIIDFVKNYKQSINTSKIYLVPWFNMYEPLIAYRVNNNKKIKIDKYISFINNFSKCARGNYLNNIWDVFIENKIMIQYNKFNPSNTLMNQIYLFNHYIIKNYKYLTYSSIQYPRIFYQNSINNSPPTIITISHNNLSKPNTSNISTKPNIDNKPITSNISAKPNTGDESIASTKFAVGDESDTRDKLVKPIRPSAGNKFARPIRSITRNKFTRPIISITHNKFAPRDKVDKPIDSKSVGIGKSTGDETSGPITEDDASRPITGSKSTPVDKSTGDGASITFAYKDVGDDASIPITDDDASRPITCSKSTGDAAGDADEPFTDDAVGEAAKPFTDDAAGDADKPFTDDAAGDADKPFTDDTAGDADKSVTDDAAGEAAKSFTGDDASIPITDDHLKEIIYLRQKIKIIEINNQKKMDNLIKILNNKIKLINNIHD